MNTQQTKDTIKDFLKFFDESGFQFSDLFKNEDNVIDEFIELRQQKEKLNKSLKTENKRTLCIDPEMLCSACEYESRCPILTKQKEKLLDESCKFDAVQERDIEDLEREENLNN